MSCRNCKESCFDEVEVYKEEFFYEKMDKKSSFVGRPYATKKKIVVSVRKKCSIDAITRKIVPPQFMGDFIDNDGSHERLMEYFMKEKKRTLILWGKAGRGKTRICWEIIKRNLFRNINGFCFQRVSELPLIFHLSEKGGNEKAEYIKALNDISRRDLVVFDDFMSCPRLTEIDFLSNFESLWNSIRAKKIILTTNFNPLDENVFRLPETLRSRIFGGSIIFNVKGEDMRGKPEIFV